MKIYFSVRSNTTTSTTVPFTKPSGTTTAQAKIRTPDTNDYVDTDIIQVTVNANNITLTIDGSDAVTANWPRQFRVNLTNGSRTWTAVEGTVYFQANSSTEITVPDGAISPSKLSADVVEYVQDIVGTMVTSGAGATVNYNDAAGTLTITATGSSLDTEAVQDIVGAQIASGTNISAVYNDTAGTVTISVTGLTKASVGLGNVDNTADTAKPVSTATQTALDGKANSTHTHTDGDINNFVEVVQDIVANLIVAGANVTKTYDDAANTLTIAATGGGGGGTDAEVVRDTIAAALVSGTGVNITVDDAADTITIAASTNLQAINNIATNGFIARTGAGTYAARVIAGTTNTIVITNDNGVSGNPTINVGTNVTQNSSTQTLTSKTLTAPRITSGSHIADSAGNEAIRVSTTASAVNDITVTNAATGQAPVIAASGDDTNVSLTLSPKGSGNVNVNGDVISTAGGTLTLTNKTLTAPKLVAGGFLADTNGNEILRVGPLVASAVNEVTVNNAAAGTAPSLEATGGDTNIGLNLKTKGTGTVQVNGTDVSLSGHTHAIDSLPLGIPATVTYTGGAWPARTTATSQAGRRVIFIGNPGGTAPGDALADDIWTQG